MTHEPRPDPEDRAPGDHIPGWMAPAELRWLHAQATRMNSIVEVGTNRGRSAYALALGALENRGTLTCIDLWDDPGGHGYLAFLENVGPLGNARGIAGRSPEIISTLAEDHGLTEADMVFIDGDHSYDSVLADIDGWLPIATKLLCGHDFYEPLAAANHPGVARAVRERFRDAFRVADGTSIWYVEL